MFKKLQKIIERTLNVSEGEWGRLAIAWLTRFFFQTGFVIGWTLLVALFVSRMGVNYLPLFFLINATLIILGSIGFAFLIGKISPYKLAIGTTLLTIFTLFFARSILDNNSYLYFFLFALIAEAAFCRQISILLSNFAERLFTPLEGERMFPLIESAETFGGIGAGLVAVIGVNYFTPEELIFAWIGFLVILVLLLVFYSWWSERDLPKLIFEKESLGEDISRLQQIYNGARYLRRYKFLRNIAVAILLQWLFFTLLDFQYTLVVQHNSELLQAEAHGAQLTHGAASDSLESQMTHGLGILHILFSAGGLLMQLFFASRIVGKLGVVRTFLLHPLVSLFSFGIMLPFHGFNTVVFAKFQNEATGVLAKNSIHNSYYSFPEKMREAVKEFLEGFMRPLGSLFGALILLALNFLLPSNFALSVDIALVLGALISIILVWQTRESFTHLSKKILEKPGLHPDKFDAVEVLAQPGHHEPTEHLIRSLHFRHEPTELRIKILQTLGTIRDENTIPDILEALAPDESPEVQLAAIQALGEFHNLGKYFYTQAFTRYRVVHMLSDMLRRPQTSKKIRRAIIQVFAGLHEVEIVPILLHMLEDSDPEIRADAVYVMGFFHDTSTAYFLEKYLIDEQAKVRANTLITLWQFKRYRLKLLIKLVALLESEHLEDQLAAIFVLGEIQAHQEIHRLRDFLEHANHDIRIYSALALAKMGYEDVFDQIIDEILDEDAQKSEQARKMITHLPDAIRKKFKKTMRRRVSSKISDLLKSAKVKYAHKLSPAILGKLHDYYKLIEEEGEAMRIRLLLAKK